MRSLPNVHPGLGLYAPVAIGLIMVLVWSSLFYVEAGQDLRLQYAAKLITGALAVVGAAFAIWRWYDPWSERAAGSRFLVRWGNSDCSIA